MRPLAKSEKHRQPLVYGRHLFPRKLAEHPPDPPLTDGPPIILFLQFLWGSLSGCRRLFSRRHDVIHNNPPQSNHYIGRITPAPCYRQCVVSTATLRPALIRNQEVQAAADPP
jgi:hypothetical protein